MNGNDREAELTMDPLSRMDATPPPPVHLKTYTAGEDKSRLAAAAKELGLHKARQPRQQVRHRTPGIVGTAAHWQRMMLDTVAEDARIRSVYTSHQDYDHNFFVSREWSEREDFDDKELMAELEAHGVTGGNLTAAVLGIIKGMVGPAILYLPHGFASAGYLAAIPIMILCTVMFLYSSSCLMDSWKLQNEKHLKQVDETTQLVGKRMKRPLPLSYPELAYQALGVRGESLVKTGIALMQSGVCLTYLIFVPQNLNTSVKTMTGFDVSPNVWLLLMVVIQVPLSWLRDIRKLTPTNLLANLLILYGLIVCLVFAFWEATTPDDEDEGTPSNPEKDDNGWEQLWQHFTALSPFCDDWFLFIGTSVRTVPTTFATAS
jgi:proton-coupled amino acid transporter